MCRNIKQLRLAERPATETEIYAAATQYVRKVTGMRKSSKANQATFDAAVEQVAAATRECLVRLQKG
jgi:hypothetical protein